MCHNESKSLEWVDLDSLKLMLENGKSNFYPMHVHTLQNYLLHKNNNKS